MRALRTSMAAAWILGAAPAIVGAQTGGSNLPSPAELLKISKPSQPGLEFDTPADAAAVAACKVDPVVVNRKTVGYALRDGQGKLLRKFVNTRGKPGLDQWSYYQDGFEVYRDLDLDDNLTIDEARWLNAAGTRIASVAKGRVITWKRLSAEEAGKVLVQALVGRDLGLLETVLATPDELGKLGVPKAEVERVAAEAGNRVPQVQALLKDLTALGVNAKMTWLSFSGPMPHVIPIDAGADLKDDLTLYENASVFAGDPAAQGGPGGFVSLTIPEMVKVGEVWKFVGLPRAVDPQKPAANVAQEGGIRSALFQAEMRDGPGGPENQEQAKALNDLAQYDQQASGVFQKGDKAEIARYYVGRVPHLRKVIKLTQAPAERLNYNRQVADSLLAAYATGLYPQSMGLLDALAKEEPKVSSYIAYRNIVAENQIKVDQGDNPIKLQKDLIEKLQGFIAQYPKEEESAEALLQLGSFSEFNAEEDQARKYYDRLVKDFASTEPARKGAGALRRLDLVGKGLELAGPGLNGEQVNASAARGKTLLVVFWATWAKPARDDLPELIKSYNKHPRKDLEIIGVSLDNDKETLAAFLKSSPVPWPVIFEPGGMESRLADDFGIVSLPTMVLVDPQGKVVNRSLRTAAELEKQLEKLGQEKPAVAVGNR